MSVVKFEARDKDSLPIGKFFGRVPGYFLFSMALIIETMVSKLFSSYYDHFSGIATLSIEVIIFAPFAHRVMHIFHLSETGGT